MNHQPSAQPQKLRLTTICAEIACICLVLASILFGMGYNQYKTLSRDGEKNSPVMGDNSTEGSLSQEEIIGSLSDKFGTGNVQISDGKIHYSDSTTQIITGTNGNYTIVDKENLEITTDENGNFYYQITDKNEAEPGSSTIIFRPNPNINSSTVDNVTIISPQHTSISISPIYNIALLLAPFISCVLLLLFAVKYEKSQKGYILLATVFGLQAISSLAFFTIDSIAVAILCVILAIMAVRGHMNRIAVLITFIASLLSAAIDLLTGPIPFFHKNGGDLIIIADFLYVIGLVSFLIAWFAYAYWNGQKAAVPAAVADSDTSAEIESEVPETADSASE